jgi:hypothetical protein
MKPKKTRIQNANKHLPFFLQENESFYVGLLFEDFVKSSDLKKYNLTDKFKENASIIPLAKGSSTRNNINGKYIRKHPEEMTTKKVHISYNRKDGTHVEFDRNYSIYVKVLQHKYNIGFNYKLNKHGQKVVVSDKLIYNDKFENIQKNTHVINVFCEISNQFEIFNTEYEPAIHFNKKFEEDILPQGSLENEKVFNELTELAGRYTRNNEENKAFQKRLHILKEFQPDIRGKGPNNFFGYIVFGFSDLGVAILETMYSDNATYIFKLSDYESKVIKDKQSVLKNKTMLKRIYHYDDWEKRIKDYLYGIKNLKK